MKSLLKFIILVCVSATLLSSHVYSKQLDVSVFESGFIGKHIEYLEVIDDSAELSDIINGDYSIRFKSSSEDIFNFGYTDSAYWLRVTLYSVTSKTLLLEIDNSMIDHLSFFHCVEGKWEMQEGGDMTEFSRRSIDYRLNVFMVKLNENIPSTFYIHLKTKGSLKVPARLFNVEDYIEHVSNIQLFYGAIFGIMLAMALYNLMIFIQVREMAYVFYVFFLLAFLLWAMSFQGEGFRLLWRWFPSWFTSAANTHFLPLMSLSATLFVASFLNTRESNKPIHYVLVLFSIEFSVLTLASFFFDTLKLTVISFMFAQTFFIVSCLYLWTKSNKQARYYIISWVFALAAGIILILYQLDFLKNPYSPLSLYIGMVFGVVFLSSVIGSRLNETIEELIDKNAMLTKAIEIKDEVLANTSHELKTPLNGIIGLTQSIIEKSGSRVKSVMGDLNLIEQSSNRLLRLINDILDLVKIKNDDITLRPISIDFKEFFFSFQRHHDFEIKNKGLKLYDKIEEGTLVEADLERLIQIMDNLISNAIKYTPKGSISVIASEKGEFVEILVLDTGIGIPEEMKDKVFERFEKGSQLGTGLGLNITKTLVELHGGSIRYKSKMNEGTTFYFTLPAAKSKSIELLSTKPEGASRPMPPLVLKPKSNAKLDKSIYIVDDDTTNLAVLINFLEGQYNVVPISSGEELIAKLDEQKPDLILLDIMMPNIDGYKVCHQIRKKFNKSQLPIIFQSAKGRDIDMRDGFLAGGNDYIVKPIQKIELLSRIENCLNTLQIARRPPKNIQEIYKKIDEIVYVQSEKDYIKAFSYHNKQYLLILKMTLKSIVDFCPDLIQVNKSSLVNSNQIDKAKRRKIIFKCDFEDPVSIKVSDKFSENLTAFIK